MTPPRQVLAGRTYMLTRRVAHRQFLMRPSTETDAAFVYCLAVAAERYDMRVCWVMVMSNHYHAGIHDTHGCFPEFCRYFHSLLARCINCFYGRWENLWASEPTGALHLGDPNAVFDKMIYSLCNPVNDDLVDRVRNWPGFSSYGHQLADRPVKAIRPHWFFDEKGSMPKQVALRFARPPEFAHLSITQWAEKIETAVAYKEAEAKAMRKIAGRGVLGSKAVRRQSPFSYPRSSSERRRLRPRVATKNKWRRIE
ncbi:MAG TPA: hypothetical protein PKD61_03345, partial [Polyangiaceae bacterium]|nr:hypothetical protein [Polyangiaceae bacterium]